MPFWKRTEWNKGMHHSMTVNGGADPHSIELTPLPESIEAIFARVQLEGGEERLKQFDERIQNTKLVIEAIRNGKPIDPIALAGANETIVAEIARLQLIIDEAKAQSAEYQTRSEKAQAALRILEDARAFLESTGALEPNQRP
jgi:hypothetical protein